MTTMVCFRVAGAAYCIPVDATRAVRPTAGMIDLPSPGPDIAGLIPGDPPLTVIAPLGPSGKQILVLESAGKTFGLLVEAVTGLRRISPDAINPAPEGQDRQLVAGTIHDGEQLLLLTDPDALAGRL
jgi:chemotaxis signal transduction protein